MDLLQVKPGDILAFSGTGFVSGLINVGTFGVPGIHASHVGVVAEHADRGLFMFESTMLFGGDLPCRITGLKQDGVRAVFVEDALVRPGRIYHYPLRVALSPFARHRMASYLESILGFPYDIKGAAKSGGLLLRNFFRWVRPQDLSRLFCSELCAAAHAQAGVLETKVPGAYSPNYFLRGERRWAILTKPRRLK